MIQKWNNLQDAFEGQESTLRKKLADRCGS
jgi:hypothetical protein